MSNQEVWITLRIKSELPVAIDAVSFATNFASNLWWNDLSGMGQRLFLSDARAIEVLKVEEEGHLYGNREDKPHTLEE